LRAYRCAGIAATALPFPTGRSSPPPHTFLRAAQHCATVAARWRHAVKPSRFYKRSAGCNTNAAFPLLLVAAITGAQLVWHCAAWRSL